MSSIIQFIKQTKSELKLVNWPTRKQTTIFTILVIIMSVGVAYALGFFDYIFTKLLGLLLA